MFYTIAFAKIPKPIQFKKIAYGRFCYTITL